MIFENNVLKLSVFDPVLRDILGDKTDEAGFKVVCETFLHGHPQNELRDWLYCLLKAPGTAIRKTLIEQTGQKAENFIAGVEDNYDNNENGTPPPDSITPNTVSPDVMKMLNRAEELAIKHNCFISDNILTYALLETADDELKGLLEAWCTTEGLIKFIKKIKPATRHKIAIFDKEGKLVDGLFSPSGKRFCRQFQEDVRSLGTQKATTRHMLYTILGNETGPLSAALMVRGINAKKDLHSILSRELIRPSRKRCDTFQLTRESVFQPIISVLEASQKVSQERDNEEITETDIHIAFLNKEGRELSRLFSKDNPVNLSVLSDYLMDSDHETEEFESPLHRYTKKEIKDRINATIFGQENAVEKILPLINRLLIGIPRKNRPAGVFLFLGPTGTGKTQLAKELAKYVFGDEEMMIFLEMGQFQSKESMNMFIGASPGYVGYGDGKLTNGLRDKPECVVLFDEIEKADTQVFDALLRFADEGFISDPAGPVRDGRKCIIVMTTNAGQQWLRDYLRQNPDQRDNPDTFSLQLFNEAMKELQKKGFRPEFLGRVDERVTFLPLSKKTCRHIVDSVLKDEITQFIEILNINIDVPNEVRDTLALFAYERSIEEGARAAPRTINELIVSPAIDLISDYKEAHMKCPKQLVAVRLGLNKVEIEIRE